MTVEQQYLLNQLEEVVVRLVHDDRGKEAEPLSKTVEYLQNEEPEMAYLEGEASGVNPAVLEAIKRLWKVLY